MNLSLWRTKKAPRSGRRWECWRKVALLALTGKAVGRSPHDHLRDHRIAVNGSNTVYAVVLIIFGESLCGTRPIR